jgi:hypothetical protein
MIATTDFTDGTDKKEKSDFFLAIMDVVDGRVIMPGAC